MITLEALAAGGSEDAHQKALFMWAQLNLQKYPQLKWMHHIPNGGSRHIAEAGKLKAMGVKRGVSDICLPVSKIGQQYPIQVCGLYIELKKIGGKLSGEQHEFGQFVIDQGYIYCVCYGWEDARNTIINYLDGVIVNANR